MEIDGLSCNATISLPGKEGDPITIEAKSKVAALEVLVMQKRGGGSVGLLTTRHADSRGYG